MGGGGVGGGVGVGGRGVRGRVLNVYISMKNKP